MDLENLGSLLWIYLGILLVYFAFSIYMMVWAYRKKGLLGFLLAFFLNWLGWIIVACMKADEKSERERERELIHINLNRVGGFLRDSLGKIRYYGSEE